MSAYPEDGIGVVSARPIGTPPPADVDVPEFARRVKAALSEVGVDVAIDGDRILYSPLDHAEVWKAQRLAFESMGLPYKMVDVS